MDRIGANTGWRGVRRQSPVPGMPTPPFLPAKPVLDAAACGVCAVRRFKSRMRSAPGQGGVALRFATAVHDERTYYYGPTGLMADVGGTNPSTGTYRLYFVDNLGKWGQSRLRSKTRL